MSAVAVEAAVNWPLPTTWQSRDYQLEGVRRGVEQNIVFDWGLGAGKSPGALAVAEALGAMRVLVLCPAKVIAVWRDEVAENAARQWVVWHGEVQGARGLLKNPSVARRAGAILDAGHGAYRIDRPFMAVVNYEAVLQRPMSSVLMEVAWDLIVCDESHKLAGAGAKTSRLVARITARCRQRGGRVILQTGTLMPHSALSLYGQFRALDPTVLGTSWTAFKARYAAWRILRETRWCPGCHRATSQPLAQTCAMCGQEIERGEPIYHTTPRGDRIPDGVRDDRLDELMTCVRPHVLRVSQAELDAQTGLVEAIPQLRTCTLSPAERKAYDALKRDLIARVQEGVITSANAMTNVGALQRIARGHAKNAETGEWIDFAGPGKLCSVARLLLDELEDEDPREPIVVFANWRFDFEQIRTVCTQLGRRYGELSGRCTDGLDGKYMAPHIDLLAVQWKAGSEGLNFTRARHQIDYSMSFELTPFTQAARRLNRQGQRRHVTRRVLAADDSIDLNCFYALKRRDDVNGAILTALGAGHVA